jgi:hypothetical protein
MFTGCSLSRSRLCAVFSRRILLGTNMAWHKAINGYAAVLLGIALIVGGVWLLALP